MDVIVAWNLSAGTTLHSLMYKIVTQFCTHGPWRSRTSRPVFWIPLCVRQSRAQWKSEQDLKKHKKKSEVFTTVKIQVEFFWVVTPSSVLVGYQRFWKPCCSQIQGWS